MDAEHIPSSTSICSSPPTAQAPPSSCPPVAIISQSRPSSVPRLIIQKGRKRSNSTRSPGVRCGASTGLPAPLPSSSSSPSRDAPLLSIMQHPSSQSITQGVKCQAFSSMIEVISSYLTTRDRQQLGFCTTWLVPYLSHHRARIRLLVDKVTGKTKGGLQALMVRHTARHLSHLELTVPSSLSTSPAPCLPYVMPVVLDYLISQAPHLIKLRTLTLDGGLLTTTNTTTNTTSNNNITGKVLSCFRSGALGHLEELGVKGYGNPTDKTLLQAILNSLVHCHSLRKLVLVDYGFQCLGPVLSQASSVQGFPSIKALELEDNWSPLFGSELTCASFSLPPGMTETLEDLSLKINRKHIMILYFFKHSTFPRLHKLSLGPSTGSCFYPQALDGAQNLTKFPCLTHLEVRGGWSGSNGTNALYGLLVSPAGDKLQSLLVHDDAVEDADRRWQAVMDALLDSPGCLPHLQHLTILSDRSLPPVSPQALMTALEQGAAPSLQSLTLGGFTTMEDLRRVITARDRVPAIQLLLM